MLLRIISVTKAEDARREFARDKRSSPYMVVFSILFAFTIQSLAKWLYEEIMDKSMYRVIGMPPFVPYVLIALLFFYAVYFWLFFSRVLIYFEEDDVGEFLSFLLAGSVLAIIGTIKDFIPYWPFLLMIPTCIVCLKLYRLMSRATDETDAPLKALLKSWLLWTTVVAIALLVVGLLTLPPTWPDLTRYNWVINSSVTLGLLGAGFYAVFKIAGRIQRAVERLVESSLPPEYHTDLESSPDALIAPNVGNSEGLTKKRPDMVE